MATTSCKWVTRQPTTVLHLRGLLDRLRDAEAADADEVEIIVLGPTDTYPIGGFTFDYDSVPPKGVVIFPEPPSD
jgi:hypothetical protein